jgi:CDP-diacylglycerol--glycerol-3-phosphate 3-phosphatidyltransferase
MIGRAIGAGAVIAREAVAHGLVRLGVRPNVLTVAGAAFTALAGCAYALGAGGRFAWSLRPGAEASAYLVLAGAVLVLASACDMLDGAVARLGRRKSEFGGFLDSTLDRFSDFAVYAGVAVWYASRPRANITFVLLAVLAMFNAFMISYAKARAEDFIASCKVGFWQRGERSAGILIATFAHNIPALLVQQATLPMLTVWRRISHTRAEIRAKKTGRPTPPGRLDRLRIWRSPRMTLGYDVTVGVNVAWLIFARFEPVDVLRNWLGG